TMHDYNVAFEELSDKSKKTGTLFFADLNCTANNISNVPSEIKKDRYLTVKTKCLFMHKVPLTGNFKFDLAKVHSGTFTADLFMDTLQKELINPVAQSLGLFLVKKGEMQSGSAHLQ